MSLQHVALIAKLLRRTRHRCAKGPDCFELCGGWGVRSGDSLPSITLLHSVLTALVSDPATRGPPVFVEHMETSPNCLCHQKLTLKSLAAVLLHPHGALKLSPWVFGGSEEGREANEEGMYLLSWEAAAAGSALVTASSVEAPETGADKSRAPVALTDGAVMGP
ncbi:unnamed protein product [Pleuronectes platessa]|uniref:Uncharacterized protein n=1 Tax=Pleuronectes platessa TaxID=8262 RepID=A0A9N7VIY4_PLEPL|nr:unnamed protein product [Pleuronectes platessa]